MAVLVAIIGIGCRQGEPATDPKMHPNSPLPKIEHEDKDTKAPPTPRVGDAG